jgi:hypothetical protein
MNENQMLLAFRREFLAAVGMFHGARSAIYNKGYAANHEHGGGFQGAMASWPYDDDNSKYRAREGI